MNDTDVIMRDVLSRGLADPEIQMDLLGDKNQEMTRLGFLSLKVRNAT